ncbi:16452_t:CDS:2 [Rhizophagus irregularis]|nr:16452_t:CDS:2 [Rhizophagus irregularis]
MSKFNKDIKESLTREGIQLPPVTYQPLLFDYISYCRSINVNTLNTIASIGSSLAYNQFILQQEFYGIFMNKFPELKYLDMRSIRHQIFYFPGARVRFESLCELKCDTSVNSSYFYGLAYLCQYIQRLVIVNTDPSDYHGASKLIEVQKNLKYFEWKDDHDIYAPGPDGDSYKEVLFALEESANTINHLVLDFKFTDHTSPKVIPKLHKLKTLINIFSDFKEQQLKMCVYHDLEIFKIDYYNLKAASIIIENSGGYLKKILLEPYYFNNYVNDFNEDSLILIRNIHKYCPTIECLSLIFSPSNEHFTELEKLLKNCQNLKSLLLVMFDHAQSTHENILEYGKSLLEILISSTPTNMKEIRICGEFEFSLEDLEEFLESWDGCALSILTSEFTYEKEDYQDLINKYKNNGVIKNFIRESYENVININFKM